MPKVSVIIPVYNVEKYIEKCARSLFEQTLDDIEYIYINDCSSDNSMRILKEIISEYPDRLSQVTIINHDKNTGQSGARRDGMRIAKGDYIIHCDADDWVDREMYEEMYNAAIASNADTVVCDMVLEFKGRRVYMGYNSILDDHSLMYDCTAPISVEYCSMCNRMVSSKIYKKHPIYPYEKVNMWDDVGLAIRIRYYSECNIVINKAFYHYNKQNETSTTRRPILGRVKEQIECAKQLETFFKKEGEERKYRYFISYIKLMSKMDLMELDMELWTNTFPEAREHLYVLKNQINFRKIVKCYLFAYLYSISSVLWKIKNRLSLK